ncbi:GlxA family transcriptional regulator [Williamsia sterculiae]|uniref:Transcriptional regulator, AraC family with amidase-like domain n=1 Tax=Williamsia sterculiae TaxID=1344003 RepID=A0A1N7FL81_9NOCA|nr:helix-turn-helix domain-containing protein [Williamsia sterculiae]SIS01050.1 transcriptional regulator, AraC family with amidase-like domain [Williamsia sterculiae]
MPNTSHRVVVVLLPDTIGFDATIPSMIFGEATSADGAPLYEVLTCALDDSPVTTTNGYRLVAQGGPDLVATADTVIIPGTRHVPSRRDGVLGPDLAAVFDTIRPTTRMVSICTGAFVLAASGRLDGLRATTHWAYADDFRGLYPNVDLDESVLFIDEGDVLTSAGLAAGIDLCLHIVRRDHGTAVANHVARMCVVPPWREGGQAQFIDRAVPEAADQTTTATRQWALGNLTEPLSVAQLAAHARMSARTFNRRFRAETGEAPGTWVRNRRLDRARELLESGDLSIDAVAESSGLGSADSLRHHLRRGIGMSPSAYRRTFSGTPT